MYKMIVLDFVHPPLYYTLVKIWSLIYGSTSTEAIRAFSILFGTILIPLVFIFMNKLQQGKRRYVSILTSFIFAINPFFISYSIEARSYALLAVLGILTAIVYLDIIREEKLSFNKKYLLFIALSILLVLTHYISAIYLICLGIAYLLLKPKSWKLTIDIIKLFAPSVIVLITTITIYYFVKKDLLGPTEFNLGGIGWIPKADMTRIPLTLYNFLFGVQSQNIGLPGPNVSKLEFLQPEILGVLLLVIISILLFISFGKMHGHRKLIYLLCISFLPILMIILLSHIGIQMYIERYMIIFGIGIVMLISYLTFKESKVSAIIIAAIYLILVLLLVPTIPNSQYSTLCKTINGKSILIDDPQEYILVHYYCDKSNIKLYTRNREYYKNTWLAIGYDNTSDNVDNVQYIVKKNNELNIDNQKYKPVSTAGNLTVYSSDIN